MRLSENRASYVWTFAAVVALAAGALLGSAAVGDAEPAQALVDLGPGFDLSRAQGNDAKVSLVPWDGGQAALRVATGHKERWPGVRIVPPAGGAWDLSARGAVVVELRNACAQEIKVGIRIDDAASLRDNKTQIQAGVQLAPGQTKTVEVPLRRRGASGDKDPFIGMRGTPLRQGQGGGGGGAAGGKGAIDVAKILRLLFFADHPTQDQVFEVGAIRAGGVSSEAALDKSFFPFIDEFGQYIHRDWPGKLHNEAEFAQRRQAEAADLAAHPGPADWDQWGGWKNGPALKATGFFRAEKVQDKWSLVDPDGRLFFSHGIDCVAGGDPTPLSQRDGWFRNLPPRGSPFAACYGRGAGAKLGYAGKQFDTFDFSQANLMRKYGDDWKEAHAALAHQRLRSWGLNTIGNWSNEDVCLQRRTPYTVAIHYQSPRLGDPKGLKGKQLPDVFDPAFAEAVHARMAQEKGKSAGDPWCLGYFVDNELPWRAGPALALGALQAPPDQASKKVFLDDLKAKYGAIEKLNAAWGTLHASWDALANATAAPDAERARPDLEAFAARFAERYYQTCREAVKEAAPNNLYLGSRINVSLGFVAEAAAKHCDVVSYNLYRDPEVVASWRPPTSADRPVIIGEFHFGALDRGLFHTGLRAVKDQAARAEAYRQYVGAALRHPQIVGCHWFKYRDESTTGRPSDGENYQIGFLDVTDTPYPETIAAARSMGAQLYAMRTGAGEPRPADGG